MTDSTTVRTQAEQAYTLTAMDYVRAPIGSRDWKIFFDGFKAAMELADQRPAETHEPGSGPKRSTPTPAVTRIPLPVTEFDREMHGPRYLLQTAPGAWVLRTDSQELRNLDEREVLFIEAVLKAANDAALPHATAAADADMIRDLVNQRSELMATVTKLQAQLKMSSEINKLITESENRQFLFGVIYLVGWAMLTAGIAIKLWEVMP